MKMFSDNIKGMFYINEQQDLFRSCIGVDNRIGLECNLHGLLFQHLAVNICNFLRPKGK
ncbi:hypothetical protein D3C80_1914540 [compost metagenome]